MRIALIMLAAGNSRRFGGNKLLYEIDGNPMYRYILERLMSGGWGRRTGKRGFQLCFGNRQFKKHKAGDDGNGGNSV